MREEIRQEFYFRNVISTFGNIEKSLKTKRQRRRDFDSSSKMLYAVNETQEESVQSFGWEDAHFKAVRST